MIESHETQEQRRVREITTLHDELMTYAVRSLQKAMRVGELLTEQKKVLPHGEFMPWVKCNVPFIGQATANNWMKLHRERAKLRNVRNLTEAYRLLKGDEADESVPEHNEPRARHKQQPVEPDDAAPLPGIKEVTLTLTVEQEQEYGQLVTKLGERLHLSNETEIVLIALRIANKVDNYAHDHSTPDSVQQTVASRTNGQARIAGPRSSGGRRKAS